MGLFYQVANTFQFVTCFFHANEIPLEGHFIIKGNKELQTSLQTLYIVKHNQNIFLVMLHVKSSQVNFSH